MKDFEVLSRLLREDRSIRRFDASREIGRDTLEKLVDLTRYCSSGRNIQPLKYRMVYDPRECAEVYPTLKWAGYLTDWEGPEEGERPVAYLVQCLDTRITSGLLCDDGIQLQALTLGARALGIGGCIIKSFNIPKLSEVLDIEAEIKPNYILALGYPVEEVVIEDMTEDADADYKYYRTPDGVHHVPKRPLSSLLL